VAVRHASPLVGTTATDLTSGVLDTRGYDGITRSVSLQNESVVTVFIGGSDVTATDYGYALAPGDEVSFDLTLTDVLFGVVETGSHSLRVLHLGV
jgi:hypothetical protein